MLAFARQQPLRPKRVDVNDLVSNVVKTIRGLLGDDVEISLHLSSEMVWPVLTDPAQLETSIVNLAVNAREAMPRGGRLSISTCNHYLGLDADLVDPNSAPGDYVELSVSDTGIGMPAEVMQHIFEPFYTTKGLADKPGTGLGLSTVFGFIKQSGGNISVRSGVGVGTTFRLFLPRMEEISQSIQARAEGRAAGGRETVLIVEDNAAVRNVVVRLLQSLGYETIQAGNAPERRIQGDGLLCFIFNWLLDGRRLMRRMRALISAYLAEIRPSPPPADPRTAPSAGRSALRTPAASRLRRSSFRDRHS